MINVAQHLVDHGIKPSAQRVAIMEYLMTHKTHPTVEEIYSCLVQRLQTLSKTTVYNTLKLFSENKAVLCLGIDEKEAHYDGDTSNHIHFKCKRCGRLFDIRLDDVPGSNQIYRSFLNGFKIDETHIYYKGICNDCRAM